MTYVHPSLFRAPFSSCVCFPSALRKPKPSCNGGHDCFHLRAGPPAYGHDRPAAVLETHSRLGARPHQMGCERFRVGNVDAWSDDAGESKGKMLADSGTTFCVLCM